jgi:hypothetical protein
VPCAVSVRALERVLTREATVHKDQIVDAVELHWPGEAGVVKQKTSENAMGACRQELTWIR